MFGDRPRSNAFWLRDYQLNHSDGFPGRLGGFSGIGSSTLPSATLSR